MLNYLETMKLTAIIPTLNEENNIGEAIDSISFADEVIIIDSFSSDNTVSIAERKGATIIKRKFDNFSAQKNFAIDKAQNDWIFILDADERVSDELQLEIKQFLKNIPKHTAYKIHRRNFFMGKEIRFSGWQNDKVTRLFNKNSCLYVKPVHEEIRTDGTVGMLKGKLNHFTCISFDDYKNKLKLYSRLQAEYLFKKDKKVNLFHLIVKPGFRFFRHYFLKQGFRDGKAGFTIACLQADAVFNRYRFLRNMRKTKS